MSWNNSIGAENALNCSCVIDAVQGASKTDEMSLVPVYSGSKETETVRNAPLEAQRK